VEGARARLMLIAGVWELLGERAMLACHHRITAG
jgi:hypothetical protein